MHAASITPVVAGAIVMGYFTAGLLFLRFWSRTQDPLFLIFAAAFGLLGVHRMLLAVDTRSAEDQVPYFLMRLLAYILIVLALYLKNRKTTPV
jgi:uncharacterized membrane protein HdeD (DUF308 family)